MATTKLPWTPWHQVVKLRDDLRSGELSLAIFAADLYDVVMGRAKKVYQDPNEFFALTYATFNLRELVVGPFAEFLSVSHAGRDQGRPMRDRGLPAGD